MSEKRFMASINNNVDVDYDVEVWDYNKHLDPSEVVDLLNELNDENKELRILVDSLKQQNKKFKGRLNDLGVEYYD